jgi:hypothetical protein
VNEQVVEGEVPDPSTKTAPLFEERLERSKFTTAGSPRPDRSRLIVPMRVNPARAAFQVDATVPELAGDSRQISRFGGAVIVCVACGINSSFFCSPETRRRAAHRTTTRSHSRSWAAAAMSLSHWHADHANDREANKSRDCALKL